MSPLRKWLRRGLLALLVIAATVALLLAFAWRPEPFADDTAAHRWLQPGPWQVDRDRLHLVDSTRPTGPNGDYAGSPRRAFEADLFLPTDEQDRLAPGARPVVLYLHGLASWKEGGSHLNRFLASHGYVVLAADFPLTNFFAPGGPNPEDVINQPGDVSFLIDTLLAWNADPAHRLHGRIDADRIALLGYSLGGMTAKLATYHSRFGDRRVAATVSMAGPASMFGPEFFRRSSVPFLMLAAEFDAMVPYADNAVIIPQRHPGAALASIAGATHIGFIVTAPLLRWMNNSDRFGCWIIRRVVAGASARDRARWLQGLGDAQEGILPEVSMPCTQQDYPAALNPIRQHWITKIVILAFFESVLAEQPARRQEAREFLTRTLTAEVPELSWTAGQSVSGR